MSSALTVAVSSETKKATSPAGRAGIAIPPPAMAAGCAWIVYDPVKTAFPIGRQAACGVVLGRPPCDGARRQEPQMKKSAKSSLQIRAAKRKAKRQAKRRRQRARA
jgi:hypothetical protein